MQWILVVLVGGVAPVPTDLVFENLSDCLVAEEQLRKAYADVLKLGISVACQPWIGMSGLNNEPPASAPQPTPTAHGR